MAASSILKWVAIGGGTGLSTLLRGLRPHLQSSHQSQIALTAIVTVTDDGRSSGRLRNEFSTLPPGDIRNCLVALADEDSLMTRLFRHRFPGNGELGGHSLGNLILLALNQMRGDFLTAIEEARALLGINARVFPATLEPVDLIARIGNREVRGQIAIKSQQLPIQRLSLVPPSVRALPEAIAAIREADLITLGPGSLFTSVIANLLIADICEAIATARAKKIYICNVMTEADETDGFSAIDHVAQLLTHAPNLKLDYALFNSAPISAEMSERYATERAVALESPSPQMSTEFGIRLISLPLASEERFVRHDPERLSQAIIALYNGQS